MGRIITAERKQKIIDARKEDPSALGPQLAVMIIDGNLPVEAVAKVLAVSEPTIYRWMYSDAIPRDPDKINKLKRLMTVIRKSIRSREVPLSGTSANRTVEFYRLIEKFKPLPKEAPVETA